MIRQLIESALIVDPVEAAEKTAALQSMLEFAVGADRLAKRDLGAVQKALLERESKGSTGIGNGVAVPHVKGKEVKAMSLVLGRSKAGIQYQAIDGRPVHSVFMILAPLDQAESHLQALRWISTLARNSDFRRFMLQAAGEAQIRDLLVEMGSPR
jgi:PTS system fructose-specific IIC component